MIIYEIETEDGYTAFVKLESVTYMHYARGVLLFSCDSQTRAVRVSQEQYSQFLEAWKNHSA